MKISPLQLERYFATDFHFTANREFEVGRPIELADGQFDVESSALRHSAETRKWQITLQIKYKPAPSANAPYSFSLEMVGFFEVADTFPEDQTEQMVRINGSSMLYGSAREIVRDLTGRGPHSAMMLPSVSFFEPARKAVPPEAATQPKAGGAGQV